MPSGVYTYRLTDDNIIIERGNVIISSNIRMNEIYNRV